MVTAIMNKQPQEKPDSQIKVHGYHGIRGLILGSWREYRHSRYMFKASYHRHSMARVIPRRIWGRHSALLVMMDKLAE